MPTLTRVALDTPRLHLRPVEPGDAGALFAIFSDPVVMRYWSTPPWSSPAQAHELIREAGESLAAGESARLAVVDARSRVIGTVSLFHLDGENRRAEIGYALARGAQGHGYAREAVDALVGYAFGPLGLNRLEADIDPRNTASAHLLERLGFRREGLLPQRWIVAGEVSDSALYGLLLEEWVR